MLYVKFVNLILNTQVGHPNLEKKREAQGLSFRYIYYKSFSDDHQITVIVT